MNGGANNGAGSRSGRRGSAWWRWVLLVVIFGGAGLTAVYIYVPGFRTSSPVRRVTPREIRLPPELGVAEAVPAASGDLAGCNLLIVTFDTTRADHIGTYGYDNVATPALDRLAAEGVIFAEAVATAPSTLPSHGSIMTGLYPVNHGARANNTFRLGPENVTMAEILAEHGYATGAFVSAIVLDSQFGIDQGFRDFDADFAQAEEDDEADIARGIAQRPANRTYERAETWLQRHADRKFAAWVHYYDPHFPYEAPAPFSAAQSLAYDAEIAFADFHLGRLLALLDELQVTENTLVVVAGDHGEGLGEHDELFHAPLIYESTLRVPLVFRCGQRLGDGVQVATPVSLVDVMPTVLSLLGIPVPDGLDGLDLTRPPVADRPIYVETFQAFADHGWSALLGVRSGATKFIYGPDSELYDLSSDPFEERDLIASQPGLAATMQERLQTLFGEDLDAALTARATHAISSADLAKLRSLGYLGSGTPDATTVGRRPHPRDMVLLLALADRALLLERSQGLDACIASLEEVSKKHPTFATTFNYLCEKYAKRGDLEAAEAACTRCVELRPDDRQPLMALAGLAMSQRHFDEAIDLYREVLTREPSHFTALNGLGRALRRRGDISDAAEVLSLALAVNPGDEKLPNLLAEIYASLGRGGEAIEILRDHIEADPDLPDVRTALAGLMTRPKIGDYAGAVALLREGIELTPDRLQFANDLALLLATCPDPEIRSPEQAAVMMEQVCERTAYGEPRYVLTLARVYAADLRYDDAIATAERAREVALASQRADHAQLVPRIGLAIQVFRTARQSGPGTTADSE